MIILKKFYSIGTLEVESYNGLHLLLL
jgi:hypothetical protein